MTDYLTEQEQIELLKNWIKQYSLVILAGFLIAIVSMTGWRYWQQRQNNITDHASSIYNEMLTVRLQNDAAATAIQAKKLFTHYPRTVYGEVGALMQARTAVLKKDYNNAKEQLNWVINHSRVPAFQQIAQLRLARVFLTENNPNETITILKNISDKTFLGLVDEVRGDAYIALKDNTKAREAYGNALKELPNAEVARPLLQIKYDNLN